MSNDLILGKVLEEIAKSSRKLESHSAEDRLRCVFLYYVLQSCDKVAAQTGISKNTIKHWRREAPWWKTAYDYVQKEKNDEMEGMLAGTASTAIEVINDRLVNGDVQLLKSGEQVRVPVKLRDAVGAMGQAQHHRALLRGDPTSISKGGNEAKLEQLFDKIARLEQEKVIDGEYEIIDVNQTESDS